MELDEQMRDELAQLARSVTADTRASYSQVVRTARLRQRRRRVVGAGLTVFLVIAVGLGVSRIDVGDRERAPITHPTPTGAGPSDPGRAGNTTALDGEWLTKVVDTGVVQRAGVRAGLSRAEMERVLGSATRWRVDMTFNQLGHGIVIFRTDDPTRPGSVRTWPAYDFSLLPHGRLRLTEPTGSEPPIAVAYSLRDSMLTMHPAPGALARISPGTAAQVISWTATPFTRM